jgi:HSP20 family protein
LDENKTAMSPLNYITHIKEDKMNNRSLFPISFEKDFNSFNSSQREIEKLFDIFSQGRNREASNLISVQSKAIFPKMDILENDKLLQIRVELPGLEENDIKIEFNNNILAISGEKKSETEDKNNHYHLIERTFGSFHRSIEIPGVVNENNISASMNNGILTVLLPKSEESISRAKLIPIEKTSS